MPKRSRNKKRGTNVKCVDPVSGKSVSFTVFGSDFEEVARRAHAELGHYFRTTSLTDKRHKPR